MGDQSREEKCKESRESQKRAREEQSEADLDSAAVSVFVVILVELTNTVFVNSTNITTNIETAVLSAPVAHGPFA